MKAGGQFFSFVNSLTSRVRQLLSCRRSKETQCPVCLHKCPFTHTCHEPVSTIERADFPLPTHDREELVRVTNTGRALELREYTI
jgi:hypothetical protein